MNFNTFWKWLQQGRRTIATLGGKSKFTIQANPLNGTIISSKGKPHNFSSDAAKKTWKRYHSPKLKNQQLMASAYARPNNKTRPLPQNWTDSPNKTCCPWIAATIQNFRAGQKTNQQKN
jgi:hypothetical protein